MNSFNWRIAYVARKEGSGADEVATYVRTFLIGWFLWQFLLWICSTEVVIVLCSNFLLRIGAADAIWWMSSHCRSRPLLFQQPLMIGIVIYIVDWCRWWIIDGVVGDWPRWLLLSIVRGLCTPMTCYNDGIAWRWMMRFEGGVRRYFW